MNFATLVLVNFAWCDDFDIVFSFGSKHCVCIVLEEKTLEDTDPEIKLPKGRSIPLNYFL